MFRAYRSKGVNMNKALAAIAEFLKTNPVHVRNVGADVANGVLLAFVDGNHGLTEVDIGLDDCLKTWGYEYRAERCRQDGTELTVYWVECLPASFIPGVRLLRQVCPD